MIAPRFIPLILKQTWRARTRSLLTIAGVAVAMFLFAGVQAMQAGVDAATSATAKDTTLIVYRKDRYCPFTSRLPQSYEQQIRQIDGVVRVTPMKIVVNNCRASLDVVTFRGVPRDDLSIMVEQRMELLDGSLDEWRRRGDAALIGEVLAQRRGFRVGDQFQAAGVQAYVACIVSSAAPQDQNVAYVHLDFLQFASGGSAGGIVTQFAVTVQDPNQLDAVAAAIDDRFIADQEPTATSAEKAFVARAASDVIEIVGFMRYLGWASLAAVLALVGNAIVLSVQDRLRDHAILQTLGYASGRVARLIIAEGLVLSLVGGAFGSALAIAFLRYSALALSVDSHSIPIIASLDIFLWGVLISAIVGVVAGLAPAWQASRRDIVSCFRAA